jgi:hypothetical protein
MATRGIIAVERAGGFRGRYVHWDNNPERMVTTIGALVKRDGITQVVTTLINNNQSWSVINNLQTKEDDLDPVSIVEGYGRIHTDMEENDPYAWFTEKDDDLAWAEYVYVIRKNGLDVFSVAYKDSYATLSLMEHHAWDTIGLVSL